MCNSLYREWRGTKLELATSAVTETPLKQYQSSSISAAICHCAKNLSSLCLPSPEVLVSVTEDINMSQPSDLVPGALDMLLLKILALERMNGFAVSQRLKQVFGDVLQVSDGSFYPALHKLEQEGWIAAQWKTSELDGG